ncbi:MAG: hypothetical protein RLZZ450_95 [Pseudomonadota bacterium]|jgi:hypothetical protein
MAKPVSNFNWASNANYATGPDNGTATKVAPSSGDIQNGFIRNTAAIAQTMNWVLGTAIKEWLTYLAGLAADSEFLADLEARAWDFDNTVHVDGAFTTSSTATIAGTLTASGAAHVIGSLDVDTDLNVDGLAVIDGTALISGNTTLGGTLTMPSRTVTRAIPLTFSTGAYNNAGVHQPQGYLNKQGIHFWGDDLGGQYFRPNMSFTIPRGCTLTQVSLVGAKAAAASTDPSVTLYLAVGNSVDNTTTNKGSTTLNSTTGSQRTITVSSPVVSDQFTQYVIELVPSQGSGSGDTDRIAWIDISYTTTHADENV